MLTSLNEQNVRDMIAHTASAFQDNKTFLTEVDSKIGDGDHGIGMCGGMQKARDTVFDCADCGNAYQLFEKAGKAMLMSMGGASGVIFGSLYLAGAKGQEAKASLDAADIAEMMEKSLIAIKDRGKAQVGDKTMVCALEPAVEAMKRTTSEGLVPMLKAAEEAAAQGVENTKECIARFGRAKSLMERAVGHQDAGATSVWIIFRAMREFAEQN